MPLFTVHCNDCGNEFEHLDRSISNPTQPVCPQCQSANADRMIGAPAVHYKGTGFYSTDNRSQKNMQDRVNYVSEPQ